MAYVDPYLWHQMSYDLKKDVGAALAKICDDAGSTGRVIIYDNYSGKKLAKYSQSWGFKVY